MTLFIGICVLVISLAIYQIGRIVGRAEYKLSEREWDNRIRLRMADRGYEYE